MVKMTILKGYRETELCLVMEYADDGDYPPKTQECGRKSQRRATIEVDIFIRGLKIKMSWPKDTVPSPIAHVLYNTQIIIRVL